MKIGTAGLLQVVCQFMRRRRSIRFRGLFRALRNEFDKSRLHESQSYNAPGQFDLASNAAKQSPKDRRETQHHTMDVSMPPDQPKRFVNTIGMIAP